MYRGKEYNEIHMDASLSDIKFTLRSNSKDYLNRPTPITGCIVFGRYEHYNQITLVSKLNQISAWFSSGHVPADVKLYLDNFGVLV